MLRISSGTFRPRSFRTMGRMLFPEITWNRPAFRRRLWAQRITPAATTRIDERIVPVRIAVKLPPLWWIFS